MAISTSDGIAILALAVSCCATAITYQFYKRQQSLIESQERLNNLLLEKEAAESIDQKRADLGATIVKLGSSKHRLKVWNQGKAAAHNVSIELLEGSDLLLESQVNELFPLERLDPHQSVDLMAVVHMTTSRKHALKITWSDDHDEHNERLVYVTV